MTLQLGISARFVTKNQPAFIPLSFTQINCLTGKAANVRVASLIDLARPLASNHWDALRETPCFVVTVVFDLMRII